MRHRLNHGDWAFVLGKNDGFSGFHFTQLPRHGRLELGYSEGFHRSFMGQIIGFRLRPVFCVPHLAREADTLQRGDPETQGDLCARVSASIARCAQNG